MPSVGSTTVVYLPENCCNLIDECFFRFLCSDIRLSRFDGTEMAIKRLTDNLGFALPLQVVRSHDAVPTVAVLYKSVYEWGWTQIGSLIVVYTLPYTLSVVAMAADSASATTDADFIRRLMAFNCSCSCAVRDFLASLIEASGTSDFQMRSRLRSLAS